MTTHNQENNNQENENNMDKSSDNKNIDTNINVGANTAITNPEAALAAAAQAESNSVENKQSSQDTFLNVAPSKVKDASEFGKVAVVYGGSSNERSVSLDSGAAVLQALQNQGRQNSAYCPNREGSAGIAQISR